MPLSEKVAFLGVRAKMLVKYRVHQLLGDRERPKRVRETRVSGAGIHVVGGAQLANAAKSLERRRINDQTLKKRDENVALNRVGDDLLGLKELSVESPRLGLTQLGRKTPL